MKKILLFATMSLMLVACGKTDSSNSNTEAGSATTRSASSNVIAVSSETQLDSILAAEDHLVVVDLYADWCGPCKLIEPIIKDLSGKYETVSFVKVNVDQNQDLARKYQARSIPLVIFIKNGEIVERVTGARSLSDYTSFVNKHK